MDEMNISVKTICRFSGICWNDWNCKRISYEEYKANPKNGNTDFTIEIGIKKPGKTNKPLNTVSITIHFWRFDDDWEIKSKSVEYCDIFRSIPDRQFNDFLYGNMIMETITDELDFWCGIQKDDIKNAVYNTIKSELTGI